MKKPIYLLVLIAVSLFSFNKIDKKIHHGKPQPLVINTAENEGLLLMKSKCYMCHSVTTKSHDDIIAPPMIAVKRHYTNKYDNKKDFVNAIVNWSVDPKEDNALMPGAINRFKVMPKMGFTKEDMEKIANYMYDNELEKPAWFGTHAKEMHGKDEKGKMYNK
jgi:cytochrome c551/c552